RTPSASRRRRSSALVGGASEGDPPRTPSRHLFHGIATCDDAPPARRRVYPIAPWSSAIRFRAVGDDRSRAIALVQPARITPSCGAKRGARYTGWGPSYSRQLRNGLLTG